MQMHIDSSRVFNFNAFICMLISIILLLCFGLLKSVNAAVLEAKQVVLPHKPLIGVKVKPGCLGAADLLEKQKWVDVKYDIVVDFVGYASQKEIESAGWWINCWEKNSEAQVVFSIGIIPTDGAWSLLDGANGKYDTVFQNIARKMAQSKIKKPIIIRLAWEANGNWYPWSIRHASDRERWITYWRRIVSDFKAVDKDAFLFDWTVNAKTHDVVSPEDFYPGDEYVDIVGMDVYNFRGNKDSNLYWTELLNEPYGLEWLTDFSKKHGKKISIPEWGTGESKSGDGGGDDLVFVCNMLRWIQVNNVYYHAYWDESSSYNASLGGELHPKASSLWKEYVRTDTLNKSMCGSNE